MTGYTDELRRRGNAGMDGWTAAAMRLCALALDAGLISAPDLQAQIDACRTRREVSPLLRTLAANLILAQGAEGWPV